MRYVKIRLLRRRRPLEDIGPDRGYAISWPQFGFVERTLAGSREAVAEPDRGYAISWPQFRFEERR